MDSYSASWRRRDEILLVKITASRQRCPMMYIITLILSSKTLCLVIRKQSSKNSNSVEPITKWSKFSPWRIKIWPKKKHGFASSFVDTRWPIPPVQLLILTVHNYLQPPPLPPLFGTSLRKIVRVLLLEHIIWETRLWNHTTYYTHLSIIYQENGSKMADRRLRVFCSCALSLFFAVFVSLLFICIAVCLPNSLDVDIVLDRIFVKYWLIFALHSWNKNK
jgi:hypothetical protein